MKEPVYPAHDCHEHTTYVPTFYVGKGMGLARCDVCGYEVPANLNTKPEPNRGKIWELEEDL